MSRIHVKHTHFAGAWEVQDIRDTDGFYIAVVNSTAYSQRAFNPEHCEHITEEEYEAGHMHVPSHREIFE